MVKVSFNSALGQKEAKKDVETLIPEDEKVSENGGSQTIKSTKTESKHSNSVLVFS